MYLYYMDDLQDITTIRTSDILWAYIGVYGSRCAALYKIEISVFSYVVILTALDRVITWIDINTILTL